MPNETNLNAVAAQLAVDAAYYDQKANECWDILTQLDGYVAFDNLSLTISVGKQTVAFLPIAVKDAITVNDIFMGLIKHYRGKFVRLRQEIATLQTPVPGDYSAGT